MLGTDANQFIITFFITLFLVAYCILSILYYRFLITEAPTAIDIGFWHPIYFGKQLSGFKKFLWFVMTPIHYVIFAFFLVLLFRYLFG